MAFNLIELMKKFIYILFILFSVNGINAQKKEKIKGNKNVVEVYNELSAFHTFEVHDDLKVMFSTNNTTNNYSIVTDSNLTDVVKFEVKDSILKIFTTHQIASKKKLNITLNVDTFQKINAYDKATLVQIGHFNSNQEIEINAFNDSNLKLDIKAAKIKAVFNNNADGDVYFEADSITTFLNDEIDVKGVLKAKHIELKMKKDAEAKFEGYSNDLKLEMIGAPVLKASELMNRKVEAKLTDSSTASVNCANEIVLYLDGKSKIYLHNTPNVIVKGLRGTSQILKK